jgi:hypothetical protein
MNNKRKKKKKNTNDKKKKRKQLWYLRSKCDLFVVNFKSLHQEAGMRDSGLLPGVERSVLGWEFTFLIPDNFVKITRP